MDGDKKQLLLNINGESEVVVTRKRSRKTLWALVIVIMLFATIAIGGVCVVYKILLEYPDNELSFFTATINGKVEKITVNADKNWVEYHVLGDVITKQPEVLTVHDFHENLHVIKVIDVENSNRSKCFVGTLDRQKSPSPSDIMQFAVDNSNDKIPVSMELHYEGYDWLDVEPSLLGPVYHRLCHGVETAFIFPLNDDEDDQDLVIDEPTGQSSLSASLMIEESSPVLYSFSYIIDHHQEDAQRMVRFKREEPTQTPPDTRRESHQQLESSRLTICSTYCPRPRRRGQQTVSTAVRSKRSARPNYDYNEDSDEEPEETDETDEVDVPAPVQSSQQGRGAERSRLGAAARYTRGRRDVEDALDRVRSKRSARPNYDYNEDSDEEPEETDETDEVDVPAPVQSSQQGRGAERSSRLRIGQGIRGRRDVNDVLSQVRSKRTARPNYDYNEDSDEEPEETDETDEVDVPAPVQSSQQGRGAERSSRLRIGQGIRGRRDVNDVLSQVRSKRTASRVSMGRPNIALRILRISQDTATNRNKRDVRDGNDEDNEPTTTPLTPTNRGASRGRNTVGRRVYSSGTRGRQRRQVVLTTTTAQTIVESTTKKQNYKSERSRIGVGGLVNRRTRRPNVAPIQTA